MPKKLSIQELAESCVRAVNPKFTIVWKEQGTGRGTSYTWDGSGVLRMSEADPLLAIHDVAHVMLCSKRRLKLPEFGLGADPANPLLKNGKHARCVVRDAFAYREEQKACDLHWALAAYCLGVKGAKRIESYLNTETPDYDVISKMKEVHSGLPDDFVDTVLRVRLTMTLGSMSHIELDGYESRETA